MKQFDYETSNYKHKEEVKTFVQTFNDMADKYVKTYENREQDLKRVNSNIEKKNNAIERLETSISDLTKKTEELKALKELSNLEIEKLNQQKSEISFTDSEVQKMELDDINSQIVQKKGKIAKIDSRVDAAKAKIKTNSDEKKTHEKELKDLEKEKKVEEESLYRTNALLDLINETKDNLNSRVLEIINEPYREEVKELEVIEEPEIREIEEDNRADEMISLGESLLGNTEVSHVEESNDTVLENTQVKETPIEEPEEIDSTTLVKEEVKEETKEEPKDEKFDSLLEDMFKKEGIEFNSFSDYERDKMLNNSDTVIKNLEILKKHNVPLNYTLDQSEIYYDITSQDLDDLLSIITTDDEGNGMGFSIDFTFNILKELSKINVDRLIDVYNSEFMNVNSKSGIIHLLKLTNPGLVDFEKNRRANIDLLNGLGTKNAQAIIEKYPDFINMDNPLFINLLNTFDRSDLIEKLDTDVEVVPKIVEYWKNN